MPTSQELGWRRYTYIRESKYSYYHGWGPRYIKMLLTTSGVSWIVSEGHIFSCKHGRKPILAIREEEKVVKYVTCMQI